MLPTSPLSDVSLADVLPSCLRSLGNGNESAKLSVPRAESTVLVLVDGLGAANISQASGYLRLINSKLLESSTIRTVFPSTTASALASLVTGSLPSEHGILGYRVWDESSGEFINQLSGLSKDAVTAGWLRCDTLMLNSDTRAPDTFVVSNPRFKDSSLTSLLYGNSVFCGERSIEDRFSRVTELLSRGERGLFFVYVSELDEAAHAHGVSSQQWFTRAEELESALKTFLVSMPSSSNVVLTADHGVIDVKSSGHIDFGLGQEMLDVEAVGGEPRCIQVKLSPGADVELSISRWEDAFGQDVTVLSADEVFGKYYGADRASTELAVRKRTCDFYVFASDGKALYDAREPSNPGRNMIGQHGGLTDAEMDIPFLVWSA